MPCGRCPQRRAAAVRIQSTARVLHAVGKRVHSDIEPLAPLPCLRAAQEFRDQAHLLGLFGSRANGFAELAEAEHIRNRLFAAVLGRRGLDAASRTEYVTKNGSLKGAFEGRLAFEIGRRSQLINSAVLHYVFCGQRKSRLALRHCPVGVARYSPIAGPCLKPWPEPPPTNQTLLISGCRSIRKSPFEVFSYWQTRVSTIGASRSAGNLRLHARESRPGLLGNDARLRVRIDAFAVRIQGNFQSAALEIWHSVTELFLKQKCRQCGRRNRRSPGGMPKKNTSCRLGKMRPPRTSEKACQATRRTQRQTHLRQ